MWVGGGGGGGVCCSRLRVLIWLRVLLVTWTLMTGGDLWSWASSSATFWAVLVLSSISSKYLPNPSTSLKSSLPGDPVMVWPMACPRASLVGCGRMGEMRLAWDPAGVWAVWGGVEVTGDGWYPLGGVTGSLLMKLMGRGRGIGSTLGGAGSSSQVTSWSWKTLSSRSPSLTSSMSSNWSTSQEATPESVRLAPLPCLVDFLTAAA